MSSYLKLKNVLILLLTITFFSFLFVKVCKIHKIKNSKNIVLLGKAASGKGTYGKMMAQDYNLYSMSAGEVLRQCTKNTSCQQRDVVKKYIDNGELLPNDIIFDILYEDLKSKVFCLKCKYQGVIFDGFPRKIENVEFFKKFNLKIIKVVNINIPDEEAIKRISKRKDGRADDNNLNAVKRRLEIYQSETKKVLDIFEKQGLLVNIDGIGDKGIVYKRIKDSINL